MFLPLLIAISVIILLASAIALFIFLYNNSSAKKNASLNSMPTVMQGTTDAGFQSATVAQGSGEHLPDAGTKIGNYTIISQLGFGGMGLVMKASAPDGSLVALKIIKSEHINNQSLLDRFQQEMQISSILHHQNVAEILGWGVDNAGRNYFAMEFVDGSNLRVLLKQNAIDLNKALDVFTQLCDGLKYAHSQNIIHRDIKPENIIMTSNGMLKIVDFGIARIDDDKNMSMTMTNVVMGSPIYMSPEQKTDFKHVDKRTDIYAAGAVFYEMLSGEMPGGLLRIDLIPENLRSIVEKAIAYKVEDRYADVDEVLKDIDIYKQGGCITRDQKAIRKIEDNVKLRQALIDSFYPEENPSVPGLDINAFYIPAEGIGGNYYDYIIIDDSHTGILVGNLFDQPDVSAALFLAMLRSAFKILARDTIDPAVTLKKLNDFMAGERFDYFAVFSYMIFDSSTNEISVATAGFKPVMVLKDGADEFVNLQPEGVGIGIMEDYDYESINMKLNSNDLILLSSGGLAKTKNRKGKPFGDNKLYRLVLANAKNSCDEIIEGIKNTVLYYGAGTAQEDDITIVIAKVK
jgi:serine/threonine protein kinase